MAPELRIEGPDVDVANQRAWNAYERFCREQALDLPRWTRRLPARYFAEPWLREGQRIRRETSQRRR